MAVKLKILPEVELCVLAYSGMVQQKDFEEVRRLVKAAPDYSPQFDDLVLLGPDADYSDVAHDKASEQARKFVEDFRAKQLERAKRCAFICSNDMQATMAKMFSAYVYSQSPPNVEVDVFMSLDPAIDWIETGVGPSLILDRPRIADLLRQMGQDWCLKRSVAA
jgi:hypothetical protein